MRRVGSSEEHKGAHARTRRRSEGARARERGRERERSRGRERRGRGRGRGKWREGVGGGRARESESEGQGGGRDEGREKQPLQPLSSDRVVARGPCGGWGSVRHRSRLRYPRAGRVTGAAVPGLSRMGRRSARGKADASIWISVALLSVVKVAYSLSFTTLRRTLPP